MSWSRSAGGAGGAGGAGETRGRRGGDAPNVISPQQLWRITSYTAVTSGAASTSSLYIVNRAK